MLPIILYGKEGTLWLYIGRPSPPLEACRDATTEPWSPEVCQYAC